MLFMATPQKLPLQGPEPVKSAPKPPHSTPLGALRPSDERSTSELAKVGVGLAAANRLKMIKKQGKSNVT